MNSQKRIGILFSIVSLFVLILHVLSCIIQNDYINIFAIDHVVYLFICIVSFLTIFYKTLICKITQAIIPFSIGVATVSSSCNEMYSGLLLISVSILIAYNYGFYNTQKIIKLISTILVMYISFVIFPSWETNNKYISSVAWVCIVSGILFVVWCIFKDQIDKLRDTEAKSNEKYMRVLEEAISVARDAIELCEKEKQKLSE